MKHWWWIALLTGLFALSATAQQVDTADEHRRAQAQLEAIQSEITARRQSVERRQQRLSRIERELRAVEQQVADSTRSIQRTTEQLDALQTRIEELEAEQRVLEIRLSEQAQMLEDQIESAYRAGTNDFMQMLLNQQDPSRIERLLVYYRYFNQARMEQIEVLYGLERELAQVERQLDNQHQQIIATMEQQQQQREQLRAQQREQEQAAEQMRLAQRTDEQSLTDMLQSEQELTELLAALETVLNQQNIRLDGLANLRGQIEWPVRGSIRHGFGQRRSGQVDWKGVVLNVDAEQPVRVIADGRVLFADWLRGFGLVTVVDHGNGYMSLYGYNQSLTREVGEAVRRGDTIALSGQSGGQQRPGLYFEIRHEGNPVDPVNFVRR